MLKATIEKIIQDILHTKKAEVEDTSAFYIKNQTLAYFLAYLKFLPMKRALPPNSSSIRNN